MTMSPHGPAHVPAPPPGGSPDIDDELPALGRVVEGRRKVRMADVGADRRARLDALARYLHDVAEDDAATAALPPTIGWVLRSTRMEIRTFPALGEDLELRTFCSATANRWAERTTVAQGSQGATLSAVAIWVAVDSQTGAPARLDERFFSVYGPSAGGKHASARLVLGEPDGRVIDRARPWPLRRSDVDAWGHVNNAIAWAAVEDAVDIGPEDSAVALLEHHVPIGPGVEPVLAVDREGDQWSVWLLDRGEAAPVAGPGAGPGAGSVAARVVGPGAGRVLVAATVRISPAGPSGARR